MGPGRPRLRRRTAIGEKDGRDAVGLEGGLEGLRQAGSPLAGHHLPKPRDPEGEGVEQAGAQDDRFRDPQCFLVPDPGGPIGQRQVAGGACIQMRADLPADQLDHGPARRHDGDHQCAAEMLVAARPEEPEALEGSPERRPGSPVLLGEPVPERPVGEAELKVGAELGGLQAPAGQIPAGLGGVLECRMVVGDDLPEHRLVILGRRSHGRGQLRDGGGPGWRGPGRGHAWLVAGLQELHRMAAAHPFGPHDPVHDGALCLAGAPARPAILAGGDHQGGRGVGVEGAAALEFCPLRLECHPASLDEALNRDLLGQALELVRRQTRHLGWFLAGPRATGSRRPHTRQHGPGGVPHGMSAGKRIVRRLPHEGGGGEG